MIESGEAYTAIQDYFAGKINRDQVVDVLLQYWGDVPVATPPPQSALRPPPATPSPTPVSAWPWPTSTPTPTPTPLQAPTITYTHVNTASVQVNWQHNSPDITGYTIRHRVELGPWQTKRLNHGTGGVGWNPPGGFQIGDRIEVQVRAITKTGVSPWAGEVFVVPAPLPTPTPTATPVTTPTPYPTTHQSGVGCDGKELLWGYVEAEKRYRRVTPVSDLMVVSDFENTYIQPAGVGPRACAKGCPVLTPTPTTKPWNTPTPLTFNYGFIVRNISDGDLGASVALLIRATHQGKWFLELRGCTQCGSQFQRHAYAPGVVSIGQRGKAKLGYILRSIDSGYFSEDGVEFFVGEQRSNHMAFIAKGDDYRFIVNGAEVPLEVDAEDRAAIESVVGRFRYVSDGKWYGGYGSFGSADITVRSRTTEPRVVYGRQQPPLHACVP